MDDSTGVPANIAHPSGLISGRFHLGELLGSGGSASVFEATDTQTRKTKEADNDQVVALKILHPHLSRSEAAREAFFVEARAAAPLRHPNIVAVLGVGVHDPQGEPLAWIALERAPGVALAEYLELRGTLTPGEALVVADGVLSALEVAHSAGVMHRDVSPANIMVAPGSDGLTGADQVRLLDFGLADAAGRPVLGRDILRTEADSDTDAEPSDVSDVSHGRRRLAQDAAPPLGVIGSASYMSPEQALGAPFDERGDLYQVGAVLHHVLTGRPPFVRETTAAVMRAHVSSPPPVPSVLVSGIPRAVDRLVVKALLKDPQSRYSSAAEMRLAASRIAETLSSLPAMRTALAPSHLAGRTSHVAAERTALISQSRARPPATAGATAGADRLSDGSSVPLGHEPHPPVLMHSGRRSGAAAWLAVILTVTVIAVAWVLVAAGAPRPSLAGGAAAPTTPIVASSAADVLSTPTATAGESNPVASAAPSTVLVPRLLLVPLADARALLAAQGLQLGAVTSADSASPAETVLSTSPADGSSLTAGSRVDMVIASGANAVPAVTGLGQAEAVASIQNAGLTVVVTTRQDASATVTSVLSVEPAVGTRLPVGSPVTIVVATAPPPASTPRPTITPVPTPQPTAPPATTPPTTGAQT